MTSALTLHVVLPGGVDDPGAPSGGNVYDRRVCALLAASGWAVRESAVAGGWPRPGAADRAALAAVLAAVPDDDLVLVDGLVACAVPDLIGPVARRLRIVVLVHLPLGDETGLTAYEAAELDALERATLHAVTAVVATSAWAGRRLIEHHGLPPAMVHVAAPGVDPAPAVPGNDAGTALVCVAAVTPRKGQDVLIEALASIADPGWTCTFVGNLDRAPGHVAGLHRAVDAHGLTGRVRFAGPRTGDGLAAAYAATDLLVLPSRAETYGMVVTEALARGIPVLASAVGGLPEALGYTTGHDVPGMLVPADDPAALAAALRSWLTEPGTRRRLRAAALARRSHLHDWHSTTTILAGVLERLPAVRRP